MAHTAQNFIPVLTSEAGSCLTTANWNEVGINAASYNLDTLLLKPGSELLKKVSDLAHYLNWSGTIVLNASRLVANKEGVYTLVSPFDGSKTKLASDELIAIIQHLKPEIVLLPPRILKNYPQVWDNWNDAIMPYLAIDDLIFSSVQRTHGVYCHLDGLNSAALEQLNKYTHLPRYVQGPISFDLIQSLSNQKIDFIESDEPAKMAMDGIVYGIGENIDLRDDSTAMEFEVIDAQCACPTCTQQLTKAYLHHLYLHTPLLCQRFLIQHNVYHTQNSLRK